MGTEWQRCMCQILICFTYNSWDSGGFLTSICWCCENGNKKFPMAYLSSLELTDGRGQREGVVMTNLGRPWIMDFVWVHRDCRYLISITSSLTDGNPYSHWWWRQPKLSLEDMGLPNNLDTVHQRLTVPQPKACEIYYNACGSIDQHCNWLLQDTLQMEKKILTKNWAKRVTTSLFGMYCVDAWVMNKVLCTSVSEKDTPKISQ